MSTVRAIASQFSPSAGLQAAGCRSITFQQWLDQPGLGVIPFAYHDGLAQGVFEQNIGTLQIMVLPKGEVKPCRIAQRIDHCVDFGAQATTTAPNRLHVQVTPYLT